MVPDPCEPQGNMVYHFTDKRLFGRHSLMRNLMTILVMTLAVPGLGADQKTTAAPTAQTKAPQPPPASDVGASLKYLERRWVFALATKDIKTLTEILDDSYMDTDENGARTDKKGVLAALQSGDLKFASIKLSDMLVHSFGDAAVVTGKAEQSGTFKDKAMPAFVAFTDTFVLMNGAWKVAASHRSALVY
jgi:ketosteroid isomerase-like protein